MNEVNLETQKAGWLDNLSVAQRIYVLVLVPLMLLMLIGSGAIFALNKNQLVLNDLRNRLALIETGNTVILRTQQDYLLLLHKVTQGSLEWEQGLETLKISEQGLREVLLPHYREASQQLLETVDSEAERERIKLTLERTAALDAMLREGIRLLERGEPEALETYLKEQLGEAVLPLQEGLQQQVDEDLRRTHTIFDLANQDARRFLVSAVVLILVGMTLAALLGLLIYRSIAHHINRLIGTIRDISAGDLNARVQLSGRNELAELGMAFDSMVEDRIATQRRINTEHQRLNESVFALLEAVADLSERNLTVRAKVTEDATGPLADAINQLAEDTADVLLQVREVAVSVEKSSQEVNRYAVSVNELAALEQHEAQETAQQLAVIVKRLDSIAASAQQANTVADSTSVATRQARASVSRTLDSMAGIRDTVQETAKRLKRLGERSQEISRIIDIINNVSERTTVLALNANMQATAAGEAGRGFSVIAEEIQQLAENSRESTDQISVLVLNIQQEANTTIANMDQTIAEVVGGSQLAEEAAQQMQASLTATIELVKAVEQIAADSVEQVHISQELQDRAKRILEATQTTGRELEALTSLTGNMAKYGQQLVSSVNVFKLDT